jgi:hypothetical protein
MSVDNHRTDGGPGPGNLFNRCKEIIAAWLGDPGRSIGSSLDARKTLLGSPSLSYAANLDLFGNYFDFTFPEPFMSLPWQLAQAIGVGL